MHQSQVFFIIIFFFVANRSWIKSFLEGFIKERPSARSLEDNDTLRFIENKTGLKLRKITLLETTATWGMMAGLPTFPYMVISRDAYENFSKDELQWLYLH